MFVIKTSRVRIAPCMAASGPASIHSHTANKGGRREHRGEDPPERICIADAEQTLSLLCIQNGQSVGLQVLSAPNQRRQKSRTLTQPSPSEWMHFIPGRRTGPASLPCPRPLQSLSQSAHARPRSRIPRPPHAVGCWSRRPGRCATLCTASHPSHDRRE